MSNSLGKFVSRQPQLAALAICLQGSVRTDMATGAAATQSAPLAGGMYDVWVTTDTYIKVGDPANDVTTANGYLVKGGNAVCLMIGDNDRIGAVSAAAGTLSYHKVS